MSRKQIGTQIENLRKKLNLSRYKVAQDTGLKLSQIKNIEEATTGYTVDILLKYTDSLNCKIEIKQKSIK